MTIDPHSGSVPELYSQRSVDGQNGNRVSRGPLARPGQLSLQSAQREPVEAQLYKSYYPNPQSYEHPLQYSEDHPSAPVAHIIHQPYKNYTSSVVFDNNSDFHHRRQPGARTPPQRRMVRKIGQRRDDISNPCTSDYSSTRTVSRSQDPHKPSSPIMTEQSGERLAKQQLGEVSTTDATASLSTVPRNTSQTQPVRARAASPRVERGPPEPPIKSESARSMHISGLISHSDTKVGPTYKIAIRQQPKAARACGFGERDRRVIDPPPILQMTIEDPDATPEEIREKLKSPFSVMHCTLWNAEKDMDDGAMPDSGDRRQQRRLMGNLVSSPFVGLDEHDVEGCFFTFPDLSCRTSGQYRLRFVLVVLDPANMKPGTQARFQSTVISEIFTVYAAKDFPGMKTSTALTKRLKNQGCLISVKKGSDKAGRLEKSAASHLDSEDEDGEDDVEGEGKISRKRQKI